MSNKKEDINTKRELAKMYYMSGLTQKDIADKINISRVTINKWVSLGDWEVLRAAKTITRKELIVKMLKGANDKLETGEMSADEMCKIASAIEKIDKQTNVVTVIEVFSAYNHWLVARMKLDSELTPELVKVMNKYQDIFIGEQLNTTSIININA